MISILCTGFVGISQLWVIHAASLVAIALFDDLICFLLGKMQDVLNNISLNDFLEEFITDNAFATKLTRLRRELLLGLSCESRVVDETVDKDENMVSNLAEFELSACLVLLLDVFQQLVANLIGNVIYVRTSKECCDGIYKGDLLEGAIRNGKTNLPTRIWAVRYDIRSVILCLFPSFTLDSLGIQLHVFLESTDFQLFAIQPDLDPPRGTCEIVYPSLE